MRKRHKKKKGIFILIMIIIIILTVFLILFYIIEKNISPSALKQAEYYSQMTANKIISKTVSDYLNDNEYKYSDFSVILYDENGKPVSIETLTYNVNKVQSELALKISEEFENKNIKTKIPIGSLTDSYILSGRGIKLPLNINPIGNVEVKLESEFISAGVNQTCHKISAVIKMDINSSIPLYNFSTNTEFEFLIAENIIVGDVPNYIYKSIY